MSIRSRPGNRPTAFDRPSPRSWIRATPVAIALVLAAGLALSLPAFSLAGRGAITADWEPGKPTSFAGRECPHPERQLVIVTAPVRDGKHAARFSVTPSDVWSNGSVRCLVADYTSGETAGDDFVYELSLLIPAAGISSNLIWELHQGEELYSLSRCNVAPLALHTDGSRLLFRIATGDCVEGEGLSTFEPNIPIPGFDPYPRGRWIDVKIRIRFSESADGIVEVWSRTAGEPWPSAPLVARHGIPTMPFSSSEGVRGTALYTEMGLYPGRDDYQGSDTVYLDAYRRTVTSSAGYVSKGAAIAVAAIATLVLLVLAFSFRRRRTTGGS